MSFWTVLLAWGGPAAVSAVLVSWVAARWVDSARIRWQAEQNEKLERLKSDLASQQQASVLAFNAAIAGHLVAHERRLAAVEGLWAAVRKYRQKNIKPLDLWDSGAVPTSLGPRPDLLPVSTYGGFFGWMSADQESTEVLELQRPFIGENLWLLFTVYKAVTTQILSAYVAALENKQNVPTSFVLLNSRPAVAKTLNAVLSSDEIDAIRSVEYGGFGMLFDLLEHKILTEANRWISGQSVVETGTAATLQVAQMLAKAAAEIKEPIRG